jgi:arylsulfatase A-like enzyme
MDPSLTGARTPVTPRLTRRAFLGSTAAGLGALVLGGGCRVGRGPAARPNVLFILTDDQRFDALGCAGNPIIQTPNVDRLAGEGIRFERAFVTTPICAASRASILTGTYERTHTYTFTKPPLGRAFTDISFPVRLRQAGYRTGIVGKFGVAVDKDVLGDMFDFTHLDGLPYIQTVNGVERHLTEVEGDWVIDFLRRVEPGRPFCLLWCPWAPHADDDNPKQYFWPPAVDGLYRDVVIPVPEMAAPEYYDAQPDFLKNTMNRTRWGWRFDTPDKYQAMVKGYYRMISGIDLVLGRILNELARLGLDGNTVIIYTSDNGCFLGERGYADKWLMYEPSIRVPLVVYDPRAPRAGRGLVRREMALNIDLAPTIMELAGISVPPQVQGRGLRPLLGRRNPSWRAEIFCEELWDHPEIPRSECVRTERWKYIQYPDHPEYVELFDLANDPDEKMNLAEDPGCARVLAELRERCGRKIKELLDDQTRIKAHGTRDSVPARAG